MLRLILWPSSDSWYCAALTKYYHNHQNSTLWAINFVRRFCKICALNQTILSSLLWNMDLSCRALSPGLRPTPSLDLHVSVSVLMTPPVTGCPSYTPPVHSSCIVAFYTSRGYGGGTATPLHTEVMKCQFLSYFFTRIKSSRTCFLSLYKLIRTYSLRVHLCLLYFTFS